MTTPTAARAMADLFASDDWNVLEADDGEAGIQSALHNRPELILCDLLMPKSNGFQVCRTIREQLAADENHCRFRPRLCG